MKKLCLYLALLFSVTLPVFAQNTTSITGTLTDSDSQTWNYAMWTARVTSSTGTCNYIDGTPVPTYTGQLSSSGVFSGSIGLTSRMVPTGCNYTFTIAALTSAPASVVRNVTVTGSFNAGAFFGTRVTAPRIQASTPDGLPVSLVWAYNTTEVIDQVIGSGFINTTNNVCNLWNGSWTQFCNGGGGGGCVISGITSGYFLYNNANACAGAYIDYGVTLDPTALSIVNGEISIRAIASGAPSGDNIDLQADGEDGITLCTDSINPTAIAQCPTVGNGNITIDAGIDMNVRVENKLRVSTAVQGDVSNGGMDFEDASNFGYEFDETGTGTINFDVTNPATGMTLNSAPICSANNGVCVPAASLPIAPVVDYRMQEGSGTTVTDFSGNNYTGVFQTGGRAPTWVPNGIQFPNSTGFDIPAGTSNAVNLANTWCYVGKFVPLVNGNFQQGGFSVALASNAGSTGGSLMLEYTASLVAGAFGTSPGPGIASFTTFVGGTGVTQVNLAYSGVHRICVVEGLTSNSTVDHLYVDGVETNSYYTQGASGGNQTSSFFSVGSANITPWNNYGLFGSTLYRVAGFAGQLSASQIQAIDQSFQFDLITRGIPLTPPVIQQSIAQLVGEGDSITACLNVPNGNCWINNLTLTNQPSYTINRFAISGVTSYALNGSEPGNGTNYCSTAQGPGIAIIWAGTNDLTIWDSSISIQTLVSSVGGLIQKFKSYGCKVYIATVISRCGNRATSGCSASGTFEAARETYNQIMRQQAKTLGADGIIDTAAQPFIGATNAYNAGAGGGTCPGATTYFQVDCVHPTTAAQPYISAVMDNSLNFYAGNTFSNPYVVTATATLPTSAKVVDATGCIIACTLTLPDGTGPSGETYSIMTGAQVVSVQGQTLYGLAQNVNGSGSVVALPTNTIVQLKIVPLAQSTAGIQWRIN